MNKYNLDQQTRLIKLAEFIIEYIDLRGIGRLLDGGMDSEDFVNAYEKIQKKIVEFYPEVLDEEEDEEAGD